MSKLLDDIVGSRQKAEIMTFINSLLISTSKKDRTDIFKDLIAAGILPKIELLSKTSTGDAQLNNLIHIFFEVHEEYQEDLKHGLNLEPEFFAEKLKTQLMELKLEG